MRKLNGKKLTTLLLSSCLMLTFVACSGTKATENANSNQDNSFTIGFSNCSQDTPFLQI